MRIYICSTGATQDLQNLLRSALAAALSPHDDRSFKRHHAAAEAASTQLLLPVAAELHGNVRTCTYMSMCACANRNNLSTSTSRSKRQQPVVLLLAASVLQRPNAPASVQWPSGKQLSQAAANRWNARDWSCKPHMLQELCTDRRGSTKSLTALTGHEERPSTRRP